MLLKQLLPNTKTDYWEERAETVLSHFRFKHPDEIDIYEICRRYGIKIKPYDNVFYPDVLDSTIKAKAIPTKDRRGIIYIQPGLNAIDKKLLLAEEFCHIYAHHQNQMCMGMHELAKSEYQAKRMAAYLLMPGRFLEDVYVAAADQAILISDIADYFLVNEVSSSIGI
jgi:Zn-dependent peptidase ImmA (M78 family)